MSSTLPCKDCFTGEVTTTTPTGTTSVIHGLQTYVATPGDGVVPKGLIVMIPDAYGWEMPNNRVLCDVYARKGGFVVFLPDFMGGSSLPQTNLPLMNTLTTPSPWLHTLTTKPLLLLRALTMSIPPMYAIRSAIASPRILSFFQALRTSPLPDGFEFETGKELKIGVAGFCWGGQHAVFLAKDLEHTRVVRHPSQSNSQSNSQSQNPNEENQKPQKLVDAVFTAHPSFLTIPSDLQAVTLPLSIAIGDSDMAVSAKGVKAMKEVMDGMGEGRGECVVLEGAKHGFAVRSCVGDEVQVKYAGVAEEQAMGWFGRWLG